MIAALKAVHLLALAVALGGGVARLVLAARMAAAPADAPALAVPQGRLLRINLWAVAVLWLTGIVLWASAWDFATLGGWFHLKLTAAVLLGGLAAFVAVRLGAGRPPAPPVARRIGQAMVASGAVAVVAAAYAFTG